MLPLFFLAGSSFHVIWVCTGMPSALFYRCIHNGIDAEIPALGYHKFFLTLGELANLANEFDSLTSNGIKNGWIAAWDRWLCCILVPSENEVTRVNHIFQDINNFRRSTSRLLVMPAAILHHYLFYNLEMHLRAKYFMPHEYITWCKTFLMLTLFLWQCMHINKQSSFSNFGKDKHDASRYGFNCSLSQLHIQMKQAFGLLDASGIFSRSHWKWNVGGQHWSLKQLFVCTTLILRCRRSHVKGNSS